MTVQIRPASEYSISQLLDIYNLTRSDYLVPMQMAPADLEEYLHVYDIALDGSVVALVDGHAVGLNLLGVRGDLGWVTRLGVATNARRQGVARALMEALLEQATARGVNRMWLEVIADNHAGRSLFESFGFESVSELIVAERPDVPPTTMPAIKAEVERIGRDEILDKVRQTGGRLDWKNHHASLSKLEGLSGLDVGSDQGSAWIAFRPKDNQLEKTILVVVSGPVHEMGWMALQHLHLLHPGAAFMAENIPANGRIWQAYARAGYRQVFRRMEMSLVL